MTILPYFLLALFACTAGLGDWEECKIEWPTIVTVNNFESASAEEFLQAIMARSSRMPSQSKSNKGGWQSDDDLLYSRSDAPLLPGTAGIIKKVQAALYAHLKRFQFSGRTEVTIRASWANVNKKASHNAPHFHNADLAGVVYLNCPGTTPSCALEFVDPRYVVRSSSHNSLIMKSNNMSDTHTLFLREGDIVIFPGWLKHYVAPSAVSEASEQRVTVAFNVHVEWKPSPAGENQSKFFFMDPVSGASLAGVRLAKAESSSVLQLWPTLTTLVSRPAPLTTLKKSLLSHAAEHTTHLLHFGEEELPGILNAREQIEAALRVHLEKQANLTRSFGSLARVSITASWASLSGNAKVHNPHAQLGNDLCGVLCVRCPHGYGLQVDEPRGSELDLIYASPPATVVRNRRRLAVMLGMSDVSKLLHESEVFVFPSWLDHHATQNDDSNILISFTARVDVSHGVAPLNIRFESPNPGKFFDMEEEL